MQVKSYCSHQCHGQQVVTTNHLYFIPHLIQMKQKRETTIGIMLDIYYKGFVEHVNRRHLINVPFAKSSKKERKQRSLWFCHPKNSFYDCFNIHCDSLQQRVGSPIRPNPIFQYFRLALILSIFFQNSLGTSKVMVVTGAMVEILRRLKYPT